MIHADCDVDSFLASLVNMLSAETGPSNPKTEIFRDSITGFIICSSSNPIVPFSPA